MLVVKLQFGQDIRRVTIEKAVTLVELTDLARSLFRDNLPPSILLKYKDDEGDFITVASDRELEEAFRLFKEQGILRILVTEVKNLPKKTSSPNATQQQKKEKSPLDEFVEAVSPYFDSLETQLRDVLPKIEGQVQEFLPNLEAMLPKIEEKMKEAEEKLKETFSPENQVVHPAICDQCSQRIVGVRWKCQTCPDYDLCNSCRQLKTHAEHQFSKLNSTSYGTRCTRRCPARTPSPAVPKEEPKKEEAKPESPKQEKKDEIVQPLIRLRIPVKVEETKVEPPKEEKEKVPLVPQPVVLQPIVQEKIETPKQERKESPFESKLKQLEEMGFFDRARNIEFLVKRKGDMIHVVKDLLE